jgi:hypothetical protein
VHVLGRAYEPERNAFVAQREVSLRIDLQALGVVGCRRARVFAPGSATVEVPVEESRVRLASAGLWTLVHLQAGL